VEKLVRPDYKERKNKSGETPAVVFTSEHKELVKEGEKWMKDTATSCSITSALIVTIAFAASITVPGGNRSDGLPFFVNESAYTLFAISNVLSLFTSTSSLLMFLSILTARYAERDFLVSLPRRLIIGLVTLFLSITSMMVTFVAVQYLLFCCGRRLWMLGPVTAMAGLPVTLFVMLQFPLLTDIVASTYGPGFLHKQSHNML
jgi:Domain of unknown function